MCIHMRAWSTENAMHCLLFYLLEVGLLSACASLLATIPEFEHKFIKSVRPD